MRNLILLFSTLAFISCSKNNTVLESSVSYINYDTLIGTTEINNTMEMDSSYVGKDSIIHFKVNIDSSKYYVVEGDLLMNEFEYTQYKLARLVGIDTALQHESLIGEIRNGQVVRWPENYVVKYCISRNTFPTLDQYNIVKENIKRATMDWESTCNIKFQYDGQLDESGILTPTGDLTFVVVGFNSNNQFIASAFFPYEPASRRRLLVDPTYFTTSFDKVGVFRHELGHTLGFRHEHISNDAPAACPDEDLTGTVKITKYDPKSVMHYFCGGMGNIKLEITEVDRSGSQSIYGKPLNN